MAQKVTCHILCFNESTILPWTLHHYATFCHSVVVHDLGSTDGSQLIALSAGAGVKQYDCRGEFDDRLNKRIKDEEWGGDDADWVIMADADELIYFPMGAEITLAAHAAARTPFIKPYGYEMLSDSMPVGEGQIYDEVKMGARDDYWYGKPICFSPKLVQAVEFSTGAHTVKARLKNGHTLSLEHGSPASFPPAFLLHFHHLGGIERIGRLYNENRARQSAVNKAHKWGLQEDGFIHAQRKRDLILPKLERVIP